MLLLPQYSLILKLWPRIHSPCYWAHKISMIFLLKCLEAHDFNPKFSAYDYNIEISSSSNPFPCTLNAIVCFSSQYPHKFYILIVHFILWFWSVPKMWLWTYSLWFRNYFFGISLSFSHPYNVVSNLGTF